ncbi:MAG: site-2 protease family protein [Ilumatobacteraceae bacterium]
MPRALPQRSAGTFQLFGFPTTIRPGFGVFILILGFLYPFPLGLWVAGAVAVFTVIHELGHALVARRNKCDASIALDFMVAYASYESTAPLTWKQKIAISLAGPGLQIGTALLGLLAFGVNPFSRGELSSSEVAAAVWWAGAALGVLNLIPLLPLDGGAVVGEIAERIFPARGKRIVLQVSFGITAVFAATTVFYGYIGLLPLFVLMLLMQWQQLTMARQLQRAFQSSLLVSEGDAKMDATILGAMLDVEQYTEALAYATDGYTKCPASTTAFAAAQAAHHLQQHQLRNAWLHTAFASQISEGEVDRLLRHSPELSTVWSELHRQR